MSVSRDYTPHTYSGDGAQTAFPVRWVFHDPAWVRAQRIVDGVATDLANGTDYTVQQGVDVGGTLTLAAPLAAGAKLLIWRDVPFEQLDRYTNTGLFDVRVVERGMDRLTVMAQQLREAVGRCVQVRMDSTTRPDQIMDDINSALAVAQASVGAAAGSAIAAGVAKDGAEVARAGAEAAKVGAEIAKSGAETARDEAGAKRGEIAAFVEQAKADVMGIAAGVPIGMEATFPVNSIPAGWLVEMGQTITKTAYPELVRYLTDSDTAETAVLPDMRGEFARGADLGRGIDTGRVVGSEQGDAIRNIRGGIDLAVSNLWALEPNVGAAYQLGAFGRNSLGNLGWTGPTPAAAVNAGISFDASRVVPTASENRPRNIAKVWCIKAHHAPTHTSPTDITTVMSRLDALAAVMNPNVGKFNVYAIRRAAGEQVATAGVETNILTEASASGTLNVIPDSGDVGWTVNEGGTYRINARVMVRPAASTGYTTIQVTCWRRRSGAAVAMGTALLTSGDASLWNNIPFDLPLEMLAGDTVYFTIRSTGNNTIIYNSAGHASITRLR